MNKPCSCYSVFGHYTHECPLLPQICQAWEAQETTSSQPIVLINPFLDQGYVAAQPTQGNAVPQPSQFGENNYQIHDEFQTSQHQISQPPKLVLLIK